MRYQTKYWARLKADLDSDRAMDPGFARHLREIARPRQISYQRLMAAHSGYPVGIEYKKKDRAQWAFILPDVSGDSAWRIQSFDEDGMIGHQCYSTLEEAAEELCINTVIDEGALDRLSQTPRWAAGVRRHEIRLAHSRGLISWNELLEQMAETIV